jgi:hypothetical protein
MLESSSFNRKKQCCVHTTTPGRPTDSSSNSNSSNNSNSNNRSMSELSKIAKQVTSIEEKLAATKRSFEEDGKEQADGHHKKKHLKSLLASAKDAHARLAEDVEPRVGVQLVKLDQVDPVTGAPRFGAVTQSKVRGLAADLARLQADAQALLEELQSVAAAQGSGDDDDDDGTQDKKPVVDAALEKLRHMIPAKPMSMELSDDSTAAAAAAAAGVKQDEESRQLHAKAESIRLKNLQEAQQMNDTYLANKAAANAAITQFNNAFKNGLEDVKKVLLYMAVRITPTIQVV